MRLPDFIVIGAAKAATTTLYNHLAAREDVFFSTPKEPEFFARDDLYDESLDDYIKMFQDAREDQICGEASTIYTLSPHFPHTAERMARAIPNVRLIYILREPVSRAYSFYSQLVKNYQNQTGDLSVPRSFEAAIDSDAPRSSREAVFGRFDHHYPDLPGIFLDGSDYVRQIESYLKVFSRNQMLFVTFEEFAADPVAVLVRVHKHIGLPDNKANIAAPAAANVGEVHYNRAKTDRFAAAVTARIPIVRQITSHLPPHLREGLKRRATAFFERRDENLTKPAPMSEAIHARLTAHFAIQRPRLVALTGLDLDHWWGTVKEAQIFR